MFEFGEICAIDAARGYVKVSIPETGNVTEWIPFMRTYYAQSIPIEVNEQVMVGQTCSGRAFVFGSTPNNLDKPYTGATEKKFGVKFSDGTLLEYDIATHTLTVGGPQIINISAQSVNITSPNITLNGAVTVIGELTAAGGIALSGGAAMVGTGGGSIHTDGEIKSGTVSLSNHHHGGVQTGGSVTTGPV